MTTIFSKVDLDNYPTNNENDTLVLYERTASGVAGTETTGLDFVAADDRSISPSNQELVRLGLRFDTTNRPAPNAYYPVGGSFLMVNGLKREVVWPSTGGTILINYGQYTWNRLDTEVSDVLDFTYPQLMQDIILTLGFIALDPDEITWTWRIIDGGSSIFVSDTLNTGITTGWTQFDLGWRYERTFPLTSEILLGLAKVYST